MKKDYLIVVSSMRSSCVKYFPGSVVIVVWKRWGKWNVWNISTGYKGLKKCGSLSLQAPTLEINEVYYQINGNIRPTCKLQNLLADMVCEFIILHRVVICCNIPGPCLCASVSGIRLTFYAITGRTERLVNIVGKTNANGATTVRREICAFQYQPYIYIYVLSILCH